MADRGKTAVAVCTQQFQTLAAKIVAGSPHAGLPVLSLPFPLDTRPEAEVIAIAAEHLPELLRLLGARS